MVMHSLTTTTALEAAYARSMIEPVVVFKHSQTCSISTMARRRMQQLVEEGGLPVYEVIVQSSRDISQKLARDLGIRHQSPQIIVIHRRKPVYDTSHSMITPDRIRAAIAQVTEAQ